MRSMLHIEFVSDCVTFRPKANTDTTYVEIVTNTDGCYTDIVGYVPNRITSVNLDDRCMVRYKIYNEFSHSCI